MCVDLSETSVDLYFCSRAKFCRRSFQRCSRVLMIQYIHYHHPVVRRISDSVTHAEARLLWRNSKISVIFKKKTNNERWHKSEVISCQKHSNLELKGKFSWMVFMWLVFGFDWFVVSHFGRENSMHVIFRVFLAWKFISRTDVRLDVIFYPNWPIC